MKKLKGKEIKKPEAKQDMHRFTVSYAPPMIQFQHPSHEIKTSQHSNQQKKYRHLNRNDNAPH
jgi:hypothetical protein